MPVEFSKLAELVGPKFPRLLEIVGHTMVSYSMDAFRQQRLGDFAWPERYPNQDEPKVNVAGVLADLNEGRGISSRRFDSRPAGIDTGQLRASIEHRIVGDRAVEVGSNLDYADRVQVGGTSFQAIQPDARRKLYQLMRTDRRLRAARDKLAPLLNPKNPVLETTLPPRPFVGLPDDLVADLAELVKTWFQAEGATAEQLGIDTTHRF